jgi:hypothetical protein
MGSFPRRRPSPAMIVAFVALLASLAGTSYAVKQIGSRQIKDNSIRSVDLRNNDVRSVDVRDFSLRAKDFKPGEIPPGPKGDKGDRGDRGPEAAIDGLPAQGGAVYVRPGVYTCKAAIVIDRNNVWLRGSGPATVLALGDHVNRPVLVLGGTGKRTDDPPMPTRRNLRVSDLSIDGNRANQDFECSIGDCSDTDVLRNNGLSLRRVEDVVVERVSVKNAKSGGLVSELGSRRLVVRDFTASGSEFDGLAGYETEDSVFTGLSLYNSDKAGLSFDGDLNHNTITDSVIAGNHDVGVFMLDAHDNVFSGVRVRDSGSHGMFLSAANVNDPTSCASGNTFTGMVVSGWGAGKAAMSLPNADCVNNLVCASQFVGDPGKAIQPSPGRVQTCGYIDR